MPYVAPEVVQRVKQIDLLTYLKNYEPYELVHFSGNVYTTRSHDSLKISNGKWMWWSRGIGDRSADRADSRKAGRRRKGGSKERRADPGTSKADGQDD